MQGLGENAGISMMAPMPYGLSMERRRKYTTTTDSRVSHHIWRECFYLYVRSHRAREFTDAYFHRLVYFLVFSLSFSYKVLRVCE